MTKKQLQKNFPSIYNNEKIAQLAKKWFKKQPETYDANGIKCYGMEDFEDFRNYMKV